MIKEPIFFERNRVGRVYTGGKLFHNFFGDEPQDGFLPEEWIASGVKAINKVSAGEKEGISKLKNQSIYFDDLAKEYPEELFGKSGKMRVLIKMLDSAIRLPAQAHPDKPFARKHFNSEYGKTESWIVVDTRPDAKIYFGFKDGVTKEEFEKAIEDSKTDRDAMERLMKVYEAKVGDVFLVPAKMVHAIGAGCLILEVQEPTDFTIQPEYWCGDYELTEQEMYIGLSKETAMECFEFGVQKKGKLQPKTIKDDNGVKVENVITPADTDCFVVDRITLTDGAYTLDIPDSYGVYIITSGEGKLIGDGYERKIKKGDYFFMPASLMGKYQLSGNLETVACY